MTPTQCVDLVQFLADRCPAMRMQDGTPDAWYADLVDIDIADGMEAVLRCTRRQTFVGLNDLLAECEAVVRQRLGAQRRAELDAQIAAENPSDPAQLQARPVRAALEGATPRRPPSFRQDVATARREAKPPLTAEELAAARDLMATAGGSDD